jgi:NAD(P)-dependent dehydrogenase (short-subunit alcohol dehydrogenase family)
VKIAVVTGGSSGIGQSAAIRIAERGAGVILTYNSNPDGANEAVATIEGSGGAAIALPLDVGSDESRNAFAERVAAEIKERWQRETIDYLVNNAGFGQMSMFTETEEELIDHLYRVLFKGPYFLTQKLLPLIADGGAIVHTGSTVSRHTSVEAGYSAYASMKGALDSTTPYLAKELSPRGIRVNVVAPGPTRTRIANDAYHQYPELIAPFAEKTALGRIGEADDIGKVIATLLSDDCGWITGQVIEASGGFGL